MSQYYDPNTGRPLPSPHHWLFGTNNNLLTEDLAYRHMRRYRDRTAFWCLSLSALGVILFVAWPSPGFGQAIAIMLWLMCLLASPLYFMYNKDLKRYFPNGLDPAVKVTS